MLNVQEYLLSHSLEELKSNHGVNYRIKNHKVILDYDQINSKQGDKIVEECRGLILRKEDNATETTIDKNEVIGPTKILSHPFHRFYNFGQKYAYPIDFSNANIKIYEKADGTLVSIYFDDIQNQWHVSTRAVPEADFPIDGFNQYTFRTLFERCLQETYNQSFNDFTSKLNKDNTYCFELISPLNRIIVQYNKFQLVLLAIRNNQTGMDYELPKKDLFSIPVCPTYKLDSLENIIKFCNSKSPIEHEGVVICDENFNRIKIKNETYLLYTKSKDAVLKSPRVMITLILLEKIDDLYPLLIPELQNKVNEMIDGISNLSKRINSLWQELKNIKDRKEFAMKAQKYPNLIFSCLISLYSNQCTDLRSYINSQKLKENGMWKDNFIDKLLELIKE